MADTQSSSVTPTVKDKVCAWNIWKNEYGEPTFVHVTYEYTVDMPLVDGLTIEAITAEMKDKEGQAVEAPEVKELRMLRTTCKKAGEDKYAVRAILRYVPEVAE